jgi:diaminohydroxyphosphoribosylaminopyrimidine deaminase/5-amino-6-(5-phosphoribosylamino)uracil reductase
MNSPDHDATYMQRALELAARGEGCVEPNPMVGCVIAKDERIVGEGWHQHFGGPHAEIEALNAAADAAQDATMYVTLEPCCHQGKTPPCTDAILAAGIRRVVIARRDPFPEVDGGGLRILQDAKIEVELGILQDEARRLNAPYLKLVETGRPWVIAKWAMTLDGKVATKLGDSKWISNEASRRIVHQIRGRADAIIVGTGTAAKDDPLLTARPPGPRTPSRIVLDSNAALSTDSQLVETAGEAPVLVVAKSSATEDNVERLLQCGCEVLALDCKSRQESINSLLDELGSRRMTNVLVEGGARVLGAFYEAHAIDEVHVFIAPKLIGGEDAPSAIGGSGVESIAEAMQLSRVAIEDVDGDIYLRGWTH